MKWNTTSVVTDARIFPIEGHQLIYYETNSSANRHIKNENDKPNIFLFGGTGRWSGKSHLYILRGLNVPKKIIFLENDKGKLFFQIVRTKNESPSARFNHSMTLINNTIYIFGGRIGLNWTPVDSGVLYVLNLRDFSWEQIVPIKNEQIVTSRAQMKTQKKEIKETYPPPRHSHGACAWGDNLFIFGGYGRFGTLSGELDDF